jgi:hypothetical protein
MRLKLMLVSVFIIAGTAMGTGTGADRANTERPAMKSCRCSPAFPGSVPQCAGSGGTDGGGTSGSGGTPPGR